MILWQRLTAITLAIYWSILFISTHTPSVIHAPQGVVGIDKPLHLASYAVLSVLFAMWFAARESQSLQLSKGSYATIFAILAGYGMFDELTQIPVGRSGEVYDWIADLIGIVVGLSSHAIWATCCGKAKSFLQL